MPVYLLHISREAEAFSCPTAGKEEKGKGERGEKGGFEASEPRNALPLSNICGCMHLGTTSIVGHVVDIIITSYVMSTWHYEFVSVRPVPAERRTPCPVLCNTCENAQKMKSLYSCTLEHHDAYSPAGC